MTTAAVFSRNFDPRGQFSGKPPVNIAFTVDIAPRASFDSNKLLAEGMKYAIRLLTDANPSSAERGSFVIAPVKATYNRATMTFTAYTALVSVGYKGQITIPRAETVTLESLSIPSTLQVVPPRPSVGVAVVEAGANVAQTAVNIGREAVQTATSGAADLTRQTLDQAIPTKAWIILGVAAAIFAYASAKTGGARIKEILE